MKLNPWRGLVNKIYLLICLFLCVSTPSLAQVTFDKQLDYSNFESIQTSDDFLYTFNPYLKTFDESELVLYDFAGKELNRFVFKAKRRPSLYSVVKRGENTLLYLSTGELVVVNKLGKEIERITIPNGDDDVKNSNIIFTELGAIIVMQVNVKKVGTGIRVKSFNTQFEEQWKYEKIPEKGKYDFNTFAVDKNGNVAVIYNNNKSKNKGICLLNSEGKEKAFVELPLVHSLNNAYRFESNEDGDWLYVGEFGSTLKEFHWVCLLP